MTPESVNPAVPRHAAAAVSVNVHPRVLKVIHLVTFFEPDYAGGIQRYVGELAREQRRTGIDASILTVNLPPWRRPHVPENVIDEWRAENRGLPVAAKSAWGIFYRTPFCPTLPGELPRLQADIVHLHAPSPCLEFALQMSPPRARTVCTVHNSYPGTTPMERWLSGYARALLRRSMTAAAAVIMPSQAFMRESVPEELLENGGSRFYIVPPGINHSRFHPLGLPRDEHLVLFVGHLRREKGLHVLIEAMAALPGLRLQVLASVSYESAYFREVSKLARDKLGTRVSFVFNPDYRRLLETYNRAGCVVAPSIGLESWNLVLLEAAACGAACVRTALPALAWADFAACAAPGDSGALSLAIQAALNNRPAMETAALQAARSYSWERTAAETRQVYEAAAV